MISARRPKPLSPNRDIPEAISERYRGYVQGMVRQA